MNAVIVKRSKENVIYVSNKNEYLKPTNMQTNENSGENSEKNRKIDDIF